MQDPNTIITIHRTMIQEEMRRNDPEYHLHVSKRAPGRGAVTWLRTATANTLFSIGNRVAPLPQPAIDPSTPAGAATGNKGRLNKG